MATAMHRTRSVRSPGTESRQALLRLLGEQEGRLSSRKAALRRDAPAQTLGVIDDEEHSMDAEELGIGAAVLQLTSQTVQGIESALRRVEAGAYGTCSDCASRISSARLRALPFADRCRACQETQDTAAPPMQGHAIAQQGWR